MQHIIIYVYTYTACYNNNNECVGGRTTEEAQACADEEPCMSNPQTMHG